MRLSPRVVSQSAHGTMEVLPVTYRWIARLPPDVRPFNLLRQFPHIANTLATTWSDRQACRAVLYDMRVDGAQQQNAFPDEVARELVTLRAHFDKL